MISLRINYLVYCTILMLFFACSPDATDPLDPKYEPIEVKEEDDEVEEEGEAEFDGESFTINVTDRKTINPLIFGMNNDWRQIPGSRFTDFSQEYKTLGGQLLRFPGGWESEFYDWETNTTPNWDNKPDQPGADIDLVKSNIDNVSIVLPTTLAMNHALNSSQFVEALSELKNTARTALDMVGVDDVGIVEIGNEWWLQYAGGVSRSEKLKKYSVIAMNIAEFIGEEFPDRNFKLLINGDYTRPSEFTDIKNNFTSAYDKIDGVALHTYVGYETESHNMADLEQRIIQSADNFNSEKNFVYLSEWMPSRDYNERRLYMEAANIIPDIFQIYALSNVDAAAFWPPVNSSIPGVGVFSWNFSKVFPVGQIFSELSSNFKGQVVRTTDGEFKITAALQDESTLVVYIPGKDKSATNIQLQFQGFNVQNIASAQKFIPHNYSETDIAEPYKTTDATVSLIDQEIMFQINNEGPYEIFKLVLKGNLQ